MSEIFNELEQEVNEDLRRDKLIRIWNQYGKYIIAALVLVLGCIIGYMSWRSYKEAKAIDSTQQLIQVLRQVEQGKIVDAFTGLRELSGKSSSDVKTLAEFIYSGLRLKVYERSGKINELQEQELDELVAIEKDAKQSIVWRDLAALTTVLYKFDILNPQELIKKLKPLTSVDRPFMFSALEITAFLHMKAGEFEEAKSLFEQISKDANAPAEMRQRAELMLQNPVLHRG
ncbi:MAG: tetratricopeptide repeat protein [Holosporales bacterium]|nr:tetratricopeptide repeat protein [Holosporales bacterium]